MNGTSGGNELQRHMAGVAPSDGRSPGQAAGRSPNDWSMPAGSIGQGAGILAQRAKNDPLMAMLIAGSIGYGLGWLTALSRSPKHEPLPDYARKRA